VHNIIGPVPSSQKERDKCPICGAGIVLTCRCFRADSVCENGHHWHICVEHQVFVEGESDHSLNMGVCTCGAGNAVDPDVATVVEHMGWKKSFKDILAIVKAFSSPTQGLKIEMLEDPEDESAPSSIVIEVTTDMDHERFREFRKNLHRAARLIDNDLASRISLLRG